MHGVSQFHLLGVENIHKNTKTDKHRDKTKHLKAIFTFFLKDRDKAICFPILIPTLLHYRLVMAFMDGKKNHLASALCHLAVKGSLLSHLDGNLDLAEAPHLGFH